VRRCGLRRGGHDGHGVGHGGGGGGPSVMVPALSIHYAVSTCMRLHHAPLSAPVGWPAINCRECIKTDRRRRYIEPSRIAFVSSSAIADTMIRYDTPPFDGCRRRRCSYSCAINGTSSLLSSSLSMTSRRMNYCHAVCILPTDFAVGTV